MKTLILFSTFLFSLTAFAIESAHVRAIPSKTKVLIEIDGKFPKNKSTDVLFVVDDSGSMNDHQENVASHIENFSQQAKKSTNNFHIGVVGTSQRGTFGNVGYKKRELLGDPKVITSSMKDVDKKLKKNLLLGNGGDGIEKHFLAVTSALSIENLEGMNAGFYRENADLAVVILTDTYDQSKITGWDFVDYLVDLKGDMKLVTLQGIMVSSEEISNKTCEADTTGNGGPFPEKIEEAIRILKGDTFSLCSTQMSKDIDTLAKNIFPTPKEPYLPGIKIDELILTIEPDVSTIKVRFGNQVIKNGADKGWFYDSANKKIIFGNSIKWEPQLNDTKITVTYRPK